MSSDLVYKQDTYQILSKCFEVHRVLGHGFLEAVYKDALEVVFQQDGILYTREKEYAMSFRNVILPHQYYADFVVMDKIILEVKCITAFTDFHIAMSCGNKTGFKRRWREIDAGP